MQKALFFTLAFIFTALYGSFACAKPLQILTGIPPVYGLVAMITQGTDDKVSLLLNNGASPHSYALKPSDINKITTADIIFMVDKELEGFMTKPVTLSDAEIVYLSKGQNVKTLSQRKRGHWHDNHEHGHEHSSSNLNDLHFWLDTDNAKAFLQEITSALSDISTEKSVLYQQNLQQALSDIDNLQRYQNQVFAPVKDKPYLVYHDGWQYLEKQNGLNAKNSIVLDEEVMMGIKSRLELKTLIKNENIKCLFAEPQFDSDSAGVLAQDSGIRIAVIDPLGSRLPQDKNLYIKMMRNNADIIAECLK